jgi:Na+/melibiose symporter-like transporter
MILRVGGGELHIGIASAIMIGMPLIAKLFFTGFLQGKNRKKPYLLSGIHLRVISLGLIAVTIANLKNLSGGVLITIIYIELLLFTLGGAFAGISYIDLIGKSFNAQLRRKFFGRKQIISSAGILVSAVTARQLLKIVSFPYNYMVLFIAASVILLIATAGFWMLREKPAENRNGEGYLETLRKIPLVLRKDPTLRTYLLYVNTIGFHTALIPFYVSYARQSYYLDESVTGNLLLVHIAGSVLVSLVWPLVLRRGGFKGVLKIWAMVASVLPFLAILVGSYLPLPVYLALFLGTGLCFSAKLITQDSVIVEISSDNDRVLYSGIVGTLSLTIIIFPILLGSLISIIGYLPVFFGVGAVSVLGRILVNRMVCPVDLPVGEDTRT